MVLADLERANNRVAAVEGRNVRPTFLSDLSRSSICNITGGTTRRDRSAESREREHSPVCLLSLDCID